MSNTNGNTIPAPRWTKCARDRSIALNCVDCREKINDFSRLEKLQRMSFGKRKIREEREWCPEADSNHRHADFQSAALPTELSGPVPANENSCSGFPGRRGRPVKARGL